MLKRRRAGKLTNRSTKPEPVSGQVEEGKLAIQMKYTLVRWEKSSEIVPEDRGFITSMHYFVICRMTSQIDTHSYYP
jgi:hypothetical protein